MGKSSNRKNNSKTNMKKEVEEGKISKNTENEKILLKDEKTKKTKYNTRSKASKFFDTINSNRKTIYGFTAGILLTILVVIIIWPDRIATLKDGTQPVATFNDKTITADDLYNDMKNYYSVSLLLDGVDRELLTDIYPSNKEMEDEVKNNADYYLQSYESYYGYTEEQFLSRNGFKNREEFLDYLRLDYRRNKYFEDYTKGLIKDEEIEKYYNDSVYGDISTRHILVSATSSSTDEEKEKALNLAKEIINKLNEGKTFDEVKDEYADSITYEDLGYRSFDANLEENYKKEMQNLKNGEYSKTPIETSYGYHIVYRVDQKDKPTLDDVKDSIINVLVKEKQSADTNLYYKALINLRKEANLEFIDTVMAKKYDDYIDEYN